MLTILNNTFVKTKAELEKAQATKGLNVMGFYKPLKGGIELKDMDKVPFVLIVNNRFNEVLFVTMFLFNGKKRYMHALSTEHEALLGLNGIGYAKEIEIAKNAVNDALVLTK